MNMILKAHNITKYYGDFKALNNINIEIPRNSIYGLLGPNGAGKTTFIRIINQISIPDSGEIIFDGRALQPNDVHYIGYLPEERGLYKSMKVGEQALYLAQLKGLSRHEARKRLKVWFDKFDIADWWGKKVQELSKGMAQKIQFIVTVLHEPKLLIFDEPFSGFDPINAALIKDEILKLKEHGASVIFSTHRMESVEELCEYIALIDKANVILKGNLQEIKRNYKKNIFEVGLHTKNPNELTKLLTEKFELTQANFNSLDANVKLNIQLNKDDNAHSLLEYLNHKTAVLHFKELIPSANDIFIQTVAKNQLKTTKTL